MSPQLPENPNLRARRGRAEGIKRPLGVTVVAGLYLAVGAIGFLYHFRESLASPFDGILIELTEMAALVCGAFLLRGHNWARWAALAWIAAHAIASAFESWGKFAVHALFCALIGWLLFSPAAARYFRAPRTARIGAKDRTD